MNKRNIIIAITTVLLAVCVIFTAAWVKFLVTPVVTDDQGIKHQIPPGAPIKSIVSDLYFHNVIQHPVLFQILIRLRRADRDIKAGEYLFPNGTTPLTMLDQIVTGSGMIYHAFTIIAGWNVTQLRAALLQDNDLHHTVQTLSNTALMKRLGHPGFSPEGQFFPDTYYFAQGLPDILLLKRAFDTMQKKLNTAWQQRMPGLPFKNAQEVLIAASLVEKETDLNEERPVIAKVLINRLNKDMLLQFDPTVIYGMGSRFYGKIRREDLIQDTPYNTYVHKGLPPTPIAIPCLESINAVAHPQSNDYLYFVARGDGSHQFSKTLAEHHAAVAAAKKFRPSFFNISIVRYYFLKLVAIKN